MKLNNIKVKNKLIILYIFSVLIPVLITNYVFYKIIFNNVKQENVNNIKVSLERIKINISTNIDVCKRVSDMIYFNNDLKDALEKRYTNDIDYLNNYNTLFRPILEKYIPIYDQIENITIYGNNNTLIKGGGYLDVSEIKSNDWFKRIPKNNSQLVVEAYNATNPFPPLNITRKISIIRRLTNQASKVGYYNILKIDLKYKSLNSILINERLPGKLFLIDDKNRIIASNDEAYSLDNMKYQSFNTFKINNKDLVVNQDISLNRYSKHWKIMYIAPESRFLSNINTANKYIWLFILINLIIPSIIIYFIAASFTHRIGIIYKHIQKIKERKYEIINCDEGNDEIGQLIKEFNIMTITVKQLIKDVYEANIQKQNVDLQRKQAEMNALQSQINPHFLFNTLESIRMRSLIKKENETADVIKYLSKILRRVLKWGNDLIPLKEEILFVQDFLNIQKYRYSDNFDFEIVVDSSLENYKIPKMSIQTFVENACIHGIEKTSDVGIIKITVKKYENNVLCIIEDNGMGISEEDMRNIEKHLEEADYTGDKIGIKNVYERLKICFENNFELNISSNFRIGTRVTINLPLDNDRNTAL